MKKSLVLLATACTALGACAGPNDPYYESDFGSRNNEVSGMTHDERMNRADEFAGRDPRYDGRYGYRGHKTGYFFDMMDTNDDGVVTRREHDTFARRMFNEADLNNNNVLTLSEMEDFKRAKMSQWRDRDDY